MANQVNPTSTESEPTLLSVYQTSTDSLVVYEPPTEEEDVQNIMGAQVRFGPGAEVTKVSLPNDFTAVRLLNVDEGTSTNRIWESLFATSGYDAHRLRLVSRRGTREGVCYAELAANDPHFAQNICRGFRAIDKEEGSHLSDDITTIPSFVRWRDEPHIGVTDACAVRLRWHTPTQTAMLVYKDDRRARQLEARLRDGLLETFGSRVRSGVFEIPRLKTSVQLRNLPLHFSWSDIKRRIPPGLAPDRIVCPPASAYSVKDKAADLEMLARRMKKIGPVTIEPRPINTADDGTTMATARFNVEADARRAAKEYDNTVVPFQPGGVLEVTPLFTANFNVPRAWVYNTDNPVRFITEIFPEVHVKVSGKAPSPSSGTVNLTLEGTDARSASRVKRFFEIVFGYAHCRKAEKARLDEISRKPQGEEVEGESTCPVCMTETTEPIRSGCGHVYCKGCYVQMIRSTAASGTQSSIKCIGDDGSCQAPFPLADLKSVLSTSGYRKLLESAMKSHAKTHPHELRSCPTPRCQQLYRPTPRGANVDAVARCPDCLVVLCTACHAAHDEDVSCGAAEDDANAALLRELNIKGCPRCDTFLERTEGCNHMECGCCHAHICWVCMDYYSTSPACYEHMLSAHGGAYAGIPGYDVYGEHIRENPDLLPDVERLVERRFAQDFYEPDEDGDEDHEDDGDDEEE